MKSKEEIEHLVYSCFGEKEWDNVSTNAKLSLIQTYTQCQEEMIEFLKAEIHRAYQYGQTNAQMMETGLERDEIEEYVNYRMLSFKKK